MRKSKKPDLTFGCYSTQIREYMGRRTQRHVASELGLHEKEISGIIRGTSFMSRQKVKRFLTYLGVPEIEMRKLIRLIDHQRLFPIVKDQFIAHRIKAMRVLKGERVSDISDDDIPESVWNQVESGLTSLGSARSRLFSKKLGQEVTIDKATQARIEHLLENYSELDLLTVGYYLNNKHTSRNNASWYSARGKTNEQIK